MTKINAIAKTITTTYQISGDDIIEAFKACGQIPMDAEVNDISVRIPSGGDYSGSNLDLLSEAIFIKTEKKTVLL